MMTHKALVRKVLKRPEVKAEYDVQAEEFGLLDEFRPSAAASGVDAGGGCGAHGHQEHRSPARLEAGGGSRRHSPSVATLRNTRRPSAAVWRSAYVPATGRRLRLPHDCPFIPRSVTAAPLDAACRGRLIVGHWSERGTPIQPGTRPASGA